MTATTLPRPTTSTPPPRPASNRGAASLYDLGYRAAVCGCYVIVTTPEARQYRIDPDRLTCTCTGFVTHKTACKHLLGARDLLRDCAMDLSLRASEMRGEAFPWAYSDEGLRLAGKSNLLYSRAFDMLLQFEARGITS